MADRLPEPVFHVIPLPTVPLARIVEVSGAPVADGAPLFKFSSTSTGVWPVTGVAHRKIRNAIANNSLFMSVAPAS
jgi:hypothetical protein